MSRTFHVKHLRTTTSCCGFLGLLALARSRIGVPQRGVVFHVKQLGYLSARNEEYRLVQSGSLCNFREIVDFLCEHAGFRE